MKKRSFAQFMIFAEKKYIMASLLLLLISISGIGSLICIICKINLISYHKDITNPIIRIIWFGIACVSWSKLVYSRNLFVKGELDYVFGENTPD